MPRFKLNRRRFLRGTLHGAVASIGLPVLEAMLDVNGEAFADGTPIPKRFGVFFWGNGIVPERWHPSGTGHGSSWSLSEELAPLAPNKEYLSVVTRANIKTRNLRGHHAGTVGIMSGTDLEPRNPGNANYASTFKRQSVDQLVAPHLRGDAPYKSLEVGVDERVTTSEGTTLNFLSHNGPDSPNPQEYRPNVVFDRLFGNGFVAPGGEVNPDPTLKVRRHILDAVKDDAEALRNKLGQNDRQRLEQHLQGISELQSRIQAIEDATPPDPGVCQIPPAPNDQGTHNMELQRQRNRTMAQLIAMGMACDRVRVWTNLFSGSVSGSYFSGIDSDTFHNLTHNGNAQDKVHHIVVFIMECFNDLLNELKAMPEGDGNMLDHTAILASSDVSRGLAHNLEDYPILIAGKAGGGLRGNVHHNHNGGNASDAVLTILRALGAPINEFGEGGGYSNRIISELLA